MDNSGGIDYEVIFIGPGVRRRSTPAQREAAYEATIARHVDEILFRQSVHVLHAAGAKRHRSGIRRAKAVEVPARKGLLRVPAEAGRLQVNRRTEARYTMEGVLKAARIGGKGPYRIKEGDLEKMLVPEKIKSVKDENLDALILQQIRR
jgi:hypothetical protein